jgi:hypothetical protein
MMSYHVPGYLDGVQVANLKEHQYCVVMVSAGKHVVRSKTRDRAVSFTAEDGKTYYVALQMAQGWLSTNKWSATLVDPQQGESEVMKLDKVPPIGTTKATH